MLYRVRIINVHIAIPIYIASVKTTSIPLFIRSKIISILSLYVGGSITGGSVKNSTNTLALKEELSSINKELGEIEVDIKKLANEFNELNSNEAKKNAKLNEVQKNIIELKEKISQKELALSDLKKQSQLKHQELVGTENVKNNTLDVELNNILEEYYKLNTPDTHEEDPEPDIIDFDEGIISRIINGAMGNNRIIR